MYKKVLWRPVGIELFFHVQICIAADCANENDKFKFFEQVRLVARYGDTPSYHNSFNIISTCLTDLLLQIMYSVFCTRISKNKYVVVFFLISGNF